MKKLVSILLVLYILMGLVGCGGNDTSQNVSSASSLPSAVNETPSTQEVLDEILTKEEQQYFTDHIYSMQFKAPAGNVFCYTSAPESHSALYSISLKGLPILILETAKHDRTDTLDGGPTYDHFYDGIAAMLRAPEYYFYRRYKDGMDFYRDNLYDFFTDAGEKCPEIIASDKTLNEKFKELRRFGILAIPYVKTEIDNGNAEYEAYFTEIGLHLTVEEFATLTCLYNLENVPDDDEADYIVYNNVRTDPKAETFDWRVWYEENEEDLNNLFKFLDAYCAEYEANTATE